MPDQTLQNKVAIVSGSTTGIGLAVAQELSSRGASIVLNYPYASLISAAESALSTLSTAAGSIAVEADLSTTAGPQALVDAAVARYGRVDILVNNAGLAVNKPLAEQTLADWDELVNLNGRGTFLLTQAVLPHLPPYGDPASSASTASNPTATGSGGGRIVNITSISARAAPPLQTIYAGTKGMVESFTRVWAKELPPRYGCTVNAVAPGPTETDGFAAAGEAFLAAMRPVIMGQTPAAKRLARPDEVAYAVAFLCEERSRWVNGVQIPVCGGLHID